MVNVHEMTRDGTLKQLFESIGDPHQLVLSQGQIVEFCRNYRDSLRQEGRGTFFLFEVNGKLLVPFVGVVGGKLEADVHRFDFAGVWCAGSRHRLVVKQNRLPDF